MALLCRIEWPVPGDAAATYQRQSPLPAPGAERTVRIAVYPIGNAPQRWDFRRSPARLGTAALPLSNIDDPCPPETALKKVIRYVRSTSARILRCRVCWS